MRHLCKNTINSLITLIFIATAITSCQKAEESKIEFRQSEDNETLNLPFSEAVVVGNMLYLSGQVGNLPGHLEVVEGGMQAEAQQAMENIKLALEKNGSSLDKVVKCTVMLADISEWGEFNKIYVKYFPGNKPARSAFGTNGLAIGAKVEIECIAVLN